MVFVTKKVKTSIGGRYINLVGSAALQKCAKMGSFDEPFRETVKNGAFAHEVYNLDNMDSV